jgi:protein SCO1
VKARLRVRMFRLQWRLLLVLLLLAMWVQPQPALAHDPAPSAAAILEVVDFEQHLNGVLPLELEFQNEQGQNVTLRRYFNGKPVLLVLSYFECTTLCPLVRTGLVESLRALKFDVGQEFDVLLVSIDPREGAQEALAAKQQALQEYGRPGSEAGWHFLTGEHDAIDTLADAVGFHFAYDGEQDEYAHPSGIVLLTGTGRIARYFYGIEYLPQDLRFGLMEASQNRIGSVVDRLLLLCYHYDPTTGKYTLLVMQIVRIAGVATVAALGTLIYVLWRQEPDHQALAGRG